MTAGTAWFPAQHPDCVNPIHPGGKVEVRKNEVRADHAPLDQVQRHGTIGRCCHGMSFVGEQDFQQFT